MAGRAKFLFDQPFDGSKPKSESPYRPKAPPQKFSQEELEAAKAMAYADGEAAGRASAEAEHGRMVEEALMAIETRLGQLAEAQAQAEAAAKAEAVTLAAAIASKLAAHAMAREPLREIEALVLRCMDDMRDEPRLVVRAHESVTRLLDERVDALTAQSGFGGKLLLVPDDSLAVTDCRVDWAEGSAERNQEHLAREVDQAVQRYIQGLRADAQSPVV